MTRERITAEELLEMPDDEFEEQLQEDYPRGSRPLPQKHEVHHGNGDHSTSVTDKRYTLFCEGEGIYQTNTLRRLVFEIARRKLKNFILGD